MRLLLGFALFMLLSGCGKSPSTDGKLIQQKVLGADISLLPTLETAGALYKDKDGKLVSLLPFLHDNGFNFIRIRLFVNPDPNSAACQDLNYVTDLAKRAKAQGFKILLDFHYSDTWADPGKQSKPADWTALSQNDLVQKLYDYTKTSLQLLKSNGITPELIQTGNEITPGMLWDNGRVSLWTDSWNTADQWKNFTDLLKNAIRASREICPDAKIILHTERSGDANATKNFYQKMTDYGIDYDIIGLSYYPFWHGLLSDAEKTINMAAIDYPFKPLMFVEIAYPFNDWGYPADGISPKPYPSTVAGQTTFLMDLITMLNKHSNVTGLFYWYPEETYLPTSGVSYPKLNRGLFDNATGVALPGFYIMHQFQ